MKYVNLFEKFKDKNPKDRKIQIGGHTLDVDLLVDALQPLIDMYNNRNQSFSVNYKQWMYENKVPIEYWYYGYYFASKPEKIAKGRKKRPKRLTGNIFASGFPKISTNEVERDNMVDMFLDKYKFPVKNSPLTQFFYSMGQDDDGYHHGLGDISMAIVESLMTGDTGVLKTYAGRIDDFITEESINNFLVSERKGGEPQYKKKLLRLQSIHEVSPEKVQYIVDGIGGFENTDMDAWKNNWMHIYDTAVFQNKIPNVRNMDTIILKENGISLGMYGSHNK